MTTTQAPIFTLDTGLTPPDVVDRFRSLDEAAWTAAYERWNVPLRMFVSDLLGYRREWADEIVGDVWVRAWERAPTLPALRQHSLCGWLYRIARNLTIDHLRHVRLVQIASLEQPVTSDRRTPERLGDTLSAPDRYQLDTTIRQMEDREYLVALWPKIRPDLRRVLAYQLQTGATQKEGCQALGINLANIKSMKLRFRSRTGGPRGHDHGLSVAARYRARQQRLAAAWALAQRGMDNVMIGKALGLDRKTVRTYLREARAAHAQAVPQ